MKCPFCENEVSEFHPNSHVVPRWMYELSFGKNQKTYGLDFDEKRINLIQDGYKSAFICRPCEDMFGKEEGYARLVFGQKADNHEAVPNVVDAKLGKVKTQFGELDGQGLFGLDFRKIQKFVFGVVLKGHIAKTGVTTDLLGEKHFSKMRSVYFDDSKNDDVSYPIFVHKLNEKLPLHNILSQPCRTKSKEGINLISFKGGGYEFNVNVQSHPLPAGALNFRFTNNGSLLILNKYENIEAVGRVLSDAQRLQRNKWNKSL